MSRFAERVRSLPRLGLGVSTEYGAGDAPGALDVAALRAAHPAYAGFLELGVEVAKGLDAHAARWVAAGLPTTYHFLDVNLDEPDDLDPTWLAALTRLARGAGAAWLCGDAGWWHFGARDRNHMLLLPPVLTASAADALADGIVALREATGFEVLPETPPGQVFVGDLDLMPFFARVCERADTGLLLDCAHLAIYQRVMGRAPTDGLDAFPLDRVVELHVAGGTEGEVDGYRFVEDDHVPRLLPATWDIYRHVAARAPNLKAVVFECERNPLAACVAPFAQVAEVAVSAAGVQRVVVRMLFDPRFRDAVYADPAAALAATDLTAEERGWVVRPDRRAYATDVTRHARALLALAEELPAATAWARAAGRDPAEFFASPAWHGCVEARGVMTLAYAGWLAEGADAAQATLVALEAAVARGRRGLGGPRGAAGTVALAPGAALVTTTEGALAWWDAVRGAAAAGTPLPAPVDGPPCVVLIAVAADGASTAEVLAEGLAGLLTAAQAPQPRAALEAAGRALGLDAADATEIVDELLASDVLIAR